MLLFISAFCDVHVLVKMVYNSLHHLYLHWILLLCLRVCLLRHEHIRKLSQVSSHYYLMFGTCSDREQKEKFTFRDKVQNLKGTTLIWKESGVVWTCKLGWSYMIVGKGYFYQISENKKIFVVYISNLFAAKAWQFVTLTHFEFFHFCLNFWKQGIYYY